MMEYKTAGRVLGLPLVHVTFGGPIDGRYRRGVAKGWIAVGDIAFGPLVAVGGVSAGGITLGGVSFGVLPLAGVAVGLAAIGGGAFGWVAVGGGAFGWVAALGGLAVARDYAVGGVASARHANDAAAIDYFAAHRFFRGAAWLMRHSIVLWVLPAVTVFVAWVWRKGGGRA